MWGVFIVSLFVVALTNLLDWEQGEDKSYDILNILSAKEEMRNEAAQLVTLAIKFRIIKKKYPDNKKLLLATVRTFRAHLFAFKRVKKRIIAMKNDNSEALEYDVRSIGFRVDDLIEQSEKITENTKNVLSILQSVQ